MPSSVGALAPLVVDPAVVAAVAASGDQHHAFAGGMRAGIARRESAGPAVVDVAVVGRRLALWATRRSCVVVAALVVPIVAYEMLGALLAEEVAAREGGRRAEHEDRSRDDRELAHDRAHRSSPSECQGSRRHGGEATKPHASSPP